jgi:nucleoside-diphosphate-sugar epimerase
MKVLITGGTGFVGSNAIKHLNSTGHDVKYLTRGKKLEVGDSVECKDIQSIDFWKNALEGVEAVIHCMARVHVLNETATDPYSEFKKTNVDATRALAEAAREKGVKKFIFLSTVGVYGNSGDDISENNDLNPNGDYAKTKIEAEELLRETFRDSQVELIILRPPLIYGPHAPGNFRSLENVISKRIPLPFGSIKNKRSFLFVDNLSWVMGKFLSSDKDLSGTYNVTDGEYVSTSYFLKNIARHFTMAFIIPFPIAILRFALSLIGKTKALDKMTSDLSFNTEKLWKALGERPKFDMEKALDNTYREL